MKFAALATLVSMAIASPILERQTETCSVQGIRGRVPVQVDQSALRRLGGLGTVEQCKAACNDPMNSECKAFSVRTGNAGGACLLYREPISTVIPDANSNVAYYNLPEGVRGGTPHNNPAW